MLTILDKTANDVLGVEVQQRLTRADYTVATPTVEKIIYQYGHINLLIVLNQVTGWNAETALDDFKFSFKYYNNIKRLAIVGEQPWNGWLQKIATFLIEDEVKYFTLNKLDNAWQWIAHQPQASKYECTICGFIYDETHGFSERNIAPNTKWIDLPSEWSCPDCKDEKADFAPIENGGSGLVQTLRVNDKAYY